MNTKEQKAEKNGEKKTKLQPSERKLRTNTREKEKKNVNNKKAKK